MKQLTVNVIQQFTSILDDAATTQGYLDVTSPQGVGRRALCAVFGDSELVLGPQPLDLSSQNVDMWVENIEDGVCKGVKQVTKHTEYTSKDLLNIEDFPKGDDGEVSLDSLYNVVDDYVILFRHIAEVYCEGKNLRRPLCAARIIGITEYLMDGGYLQLPSFFRGGKKYEYIRHHYDYLEAIEKNLGKLPKPGKDFKVDKSTLKVAWVSEQFLNSIGLYQLG